MSVQPVYTLAPTVHEPPDTLQYVLTIRRLGFSTATIRQQGTIVPSSGQPDTLATSQVNARPGDRLAVHLVIRDGDQLYESIERTFLVFP